MPTLRLGTKLIPAHQYCYYSKSHYNQAIGGFILSVSSFHPPSGAMMSLLMVVESDCTMPSSVDKPAEIKTQNYQDAYTYTKFFNYIGRQDAIHFNGASIQCQIGKHKPPA